MKKHISIIITICIILITIIGLLGVRYNLKNKEETKTVENESQNNSNNNKEQDKENEDEEDEYELNSTVNENYPKFKEITLEQFIKSFKAGNEMIIYSGRPSCPACASFTPNLEKVLDKYANLTIYYIDSNKVYQNETIYEEFKTLDKAFNDGYTYIPWFILIKDKKVTYESTGSKEYAEVINILKEYNIIE